MAPTALNGALLAWSLLTPRLFAGRPAINEPSAGSAGTAWEPPSLGSQTGPAGQCRKVRRWRARRASCCRIRSRPLSYRHRRPLLIGTRPSSPALSAGHHGWTRHRSWTWPLAFLPGQLQRHVTQRPTRGVAYSAAATIHHQAARNLLRLHLSGVLTQAPSLPWTGRPFNDVENGQENGSAARTSARGHTRAQRARMSRPSGSALLRPVQPDLAAIVDTG